METVEEEIAEKPLFRLIRSGDLSSVISYFRDLTIDIKINDTFDKEGFSALHRIALSGNEELLRIVTAEAQDIDVSIRTRNISISTPLHLAAGSGHELMVTELMTLGASLSPLDGLGKTPYDVALQNGHKATAYLILAECELSAVPSPYSLTGLFLTWWDDMLTIDPKPLSSMIYGGSVVSTYMCRLPVDGIHSIWGYFHTQQSFVKSILLAILECPS